MTDFEKMVTKLREGYCEGIHFEVWEWKNCKQIDFRPSTFCDDWACFKYDSNGNLIEIFWKTIDKNLKVLYNKYNKKKRGN